MSSDLMLLGAIAVSLIMIGGSMLSKSSPDDQRERPHKDRRMRPSKSKDIGDDRFRKRPRGEGGWQ